MPTLKRKSNSQLNNKVYASVRLLSTTKTIDNAVEHVQKQFKHYHLQAKRIVRIQKVSFAVFKKICQPYLVATLYLNRK